MPNDIRQHFSLHSHEDGYSYIDVDDYELMGWLDITPIEYRHLEAEIREILRGYNG